MLRAVVPFVLFLTACDSPTPRPEVTRVSFEAGPQWLHDAVWVEFSEPVDNRTWFRGVRLETPDGEAVPLARFSGTDGESTRYGFEVASEVAVSGTLHIVLGEEIRDLDGDPLVATTIDWELDEWFREELDPELGVEPGVPLILSESRVLPPGTPPSLLSLMTAVIWTVGDETNRRLTGVWRDSGEWVPTGELVGFAEEPLVACVDRRTLHVLWGSTGDYSSWWNGDWPPDGDFSSSGIVGSTTIACSPPDDFVIAGSASATALRIGLKSDDWAPTGGGTIAVTEIIGRPVAALPEPGRPVVAFFDRIEGVPYLRVVSFGGAVWSELRREPVLDATGVEQLAMSGDTAYVAWTESAAGGAQVQIAKVENSRWALLPNPSPDAIETSTPSIAVTDDGSLVAAWRETINGSIVGRAARWRGVTWEQLGSWSEGSGTIDSASMALFVARHPMVAWRENSSIRVALYNGPPAQ